MEKSVIISFITLNLTDGIWNIIHQATYDIDKVINITII